MSFTTHKMVLQDSENNRQGWSCLICSKPLKIHEPYFGILQTGQHPQNPPLSEPYGWTCLSETCINMWILQHI